MVLLSQQAPWYSSPRSPVQRHKDTVTAGRRTREVTHATSRRSPGCRDRVFRDGSAKYNAQPQGLRPPWVTITWAEVCPTDHVSNYHVTTNVPQRRAVTPGLLRSSRTAPTRLCTGRWPPAPHQKLLLHQTMLPHGPRTLTNSRGHGQKSSGFAPRTPA